MGLEEIRERLLFLAARKGKVVRRRCLMLVGKLAEIRGDVEIELVEYEVTGARLARNWSCLRVSIYAGSLPIFIQL